MATEAENAAGQRNIQRLYEIAKRCRERDANRQTKSRIRKAEPFP